MPAAEFFVKNVVNELVPAYFLKIDGVRIVDTNTQWATGINLWDAFGNFIGQNTGGYIIAPTNYTIEKSLNYGAALAAGAAGPGLTAMVADFWRGRAEDLQRSYTSYMGESVVGSPRCWSANWPTSCNSPALPAARCRPSAAR
jgi:hypothetical protein